MHKAFENFLFGLCFGLGFIVSYAVLRFIVHILAGAQNPIFSLAGDASCLLV